MAYDLREFIGYSEEGFAPATDAAIAELNEAVEVVDYEIKTLQGTFRGGQIIRYETVIAVSREADGVLAPSRGRKTR